MNKKHLIIAVIVFQLFFLSSMIWFHASKLKSAARILLKTVPYDPYSIFRGHYTSLRYEISSLPVTLLKDAADKDLRGGDTLFVLLKKEADLWQAQAIYKKRPPADGRIYLCARLSYHYSGMKELNLEYGIESFFLNEERTKEVDRVNRGPGMGWQERQRLRQERLSGLDEETKRINKTGISDWWVDKLSGELEVWLKEGIITCEAKDAIGDKYAKALDKIKEIDKDLSSGRSGGQRPVIVEVAVDNNGYGYPVRLFIDGKEYK